MDISAGARATLPSGDSGGVQYSMASTTATGTSPTINTYYYITNPGSFAVKGKAVVAAQVKFNDTPADLVLATVLPTSLSFEYDPIDDAHPTLAPNSSYTCTIFDGTTLIGSVDSTVELNGEIFATCVGVYPSLSGYSNGGGSAFMLLPPTYHSSDVYTFIISQ
ncbi:MAG: hypothetical protein IAI48_11030 [Candidatus Eremiobacteraeota bacterium]|nr:hypothetical protein [Candidatus Eremiobacteraeota bacterium]